MLRWLAGAAVAVATLLLIPAPASADYGPDCDDFYSSRAAQDYYESQGGLAGGDPDGLDRDADGNACDWGAPSPDIDWGDSNSYDESNYTPTDTQDTRSTSTDGFPWWGWAGGGLAGLWLLGIIRWNT